MVMRPERDFVDEQADRMYRILRERAAVEREDLEYLVEKVDRLKDDRLKTIVAELIGWGDAERAELETFVAIALEVMKKTNVSKLRACAALVEARYWQREIKHERES